MICFRCRCPSRCPRRNDWQAVVSPAKQNLEHSNRYAVRELSPDVETIHNRLPIAENL